MNARGTQRQPEYASGSDLTDVAGAAELLGTTEKGIRARVARRQIPFRRLGHRIVFRRGELLDFLDKLEGVSIAEAIENATRAGAR